MSAPIKLVAQPDLNNFKTSELVMMDCPGSYRVSTRWTERWPRHIADHALKTRCCSVPSDFREKCGDLLQYIGALLRGIKPHQFPYNFWMLVLNTINKSSKLIIIGIFILYLFVIFNVKRLYCCSVLKTFILCVISTNTMIALLLICVYMYIINGIKGVKVPTGHRNCHVKSWYTGS